MAQQGNDGQIDRVLDLPTNEAWIDPWVAHLRGLGVRFVGGQGLAAYETGGGRIRAVQLVDARGRRTRFTADWFVSAMPAERARQFWSPAVRALDPHLAAMDDLFTDWMVGHPVLPARAGRDHQGPHHLRRLARGRSPRSPRGSSGATATSSATTATARSSTASRVDISNWDAPGVLYGKPAKQCTRPEIAQEVLAQIRLHPTAAAELPDDVVHSWFLDPGVQWDAAAGRNTNATPLLVNTVGTWEKRPTSRTADPEPVPRRRLRADQHRPGDHGGRQRVGAYGGQRPPGRLRLRRRASGDLPAVPLAGPRAGQAHRRRCCTAPDGRTRSTCPSTDRARPSSRRAGRG